MHTGPVRFLPSEHAEDCSIGFSLPEMNKIIHESLVALVYVLCLLYGIVYYTVSQFLIFLLTHPNNGHCGITEVYRGIVLWYLGINI